MQRNVYSRADYGGFWRRWLADLVDGLLLGIVLSVASAAPDAVAVVLEILIVLGYMIGFKVLRGATPGYQLLGMKIVSIDGAGVSVTQIVVRLVSSVFSALALALGFLWIAFDEHKQAWHDKVAGTYVIRAGAQPVRTEQIPQTSLIRAKLFALVVAAPLVIFIGFAGVMVYLVRHTDAYQLTEQYIRSNRMILEEVGSNVEFGLIPSGRVSTRPSSGEANFSISVSGEKGKITVVVALEKKHGRWEIVEAGYIGGEGNYIDMTIDAPGTQ